MTADLIAELLECRDLLSSFESRSRNNFANLALVDLGCQADARRCSRNNFANLALERVQEIDAAIAKDVAAQAAPVDNNSLGQPRCFPAGEKTNAAPAEGDSQLLIDNLKAAHLEWLSVDGDAEEGVPYARASEVLAVAESKLRAALSAHQPKVMVNGLTEAETNETASVKGLIGSDTARPRHRRSYGWGGVDTAK